MFTIAGRLALAGLLLIPTLASAEPLRIVTSFTILQDFVENVAGERAEVSALVGVDGDAHGFEPTPTDVATVARADLVFVNGLQFEGWIDRLISASGYSGDIIVATHGVNVIATGDDHGHGHGHDDDHGHGHGHDDDHGHGHGHDDDHGHGHDDDHGHHHGPEDPHAWSSPLEAKTYVRNIRNALMAADPEHASEYEARAEAYLASLSELDAWAREMFESVPEEARRAIVGHDSFAYFGRDYGVEFFSAQGLSTDAEPAAREIAGIIRALRDQQVRVVFRENITDSRLVEQISRDGGGIVAGILFSDALSAPDGVAPDYISMIRFNVEKMVDAFKAAEHDH